MFGGGRIGLMGALADEGLARGGEVIGVIPRHLVEREVAHRSLTELHVVATMHERKALMAQLADAFVALPGGIGTLEELIEMLTWAQLGLHAKPCGLLNVDGYYDALLAFLDHAVDEGFIVGGYDALLAVAAQPAALLDELDQRAGAGAGAASPALAALAAFPGLATSPALPAADEIRPAHAGEAAALTALAWRSKAHWGYDAEFMAVLKPLLTVTEQDLSTSCVNVMDAAGEPIGWYRLTGTPPRGELEDLWLEPASIGRGAGRRLFEHALHTASELGFRALTIEADPNAEGFYRAVGATRIGDRRSPSGRTLPLLEVQTQ